MLILYHTTAFTLKHTKLTRSLQFTEDGQVKFSWDWLGQSCAFMASWAAFPLTQKRLWLTRCAQIGGWLVNGTECQTLSPTWSFKGPMTALRPTSLGTGASSRLKSHQQSLAEAGARSYTGQHNCQNGLCLELTTQLILQSLVSWLMPIILGSRLTSAWTKLAM